MEDAKDANRQSSSGLDFKLHPLVLINISDHFTRLKANAGPQGPAAAADRVLGCLLGSQEGRTVEVSNSFEIKYHISNEGEVVLDKAFLAEKQDQYKKVFPKIDVVGWYSTGEELRDMDLATHKMMMELNESPVFLLLNPTINRGARDLPISLYESEFHVVDGIPSLVFALAKFSIETSEAERIAVDQVAKILPPGNANASSQLTAHLSVLHSAMKMLNQRVKVLLGLLEKMKSGEVPYDHALMRQIVSLIRRLPAVQTPEFQEKFLMEYNDSLLVIYLASLTKGTAAINDLVDKFNLAFEKSGTGRGRRGMGVLI